MKIKKFIRHYKTFAVILANTVLLFVLINLLIYGAIYLKSGVKGTEFYSDDILKKLYPNSSIEGSNTLLKESRTRQFHIYEPYVQFREIPSRGRFINVNEKGFREIENQCSYPINKNNFNIFVFGGSTTFGYGVGDNDTIPSKIQKLLSHDADCRKICVYNFGRASYFITQERILFETLIEKNHVPDMAIFIDGLNDFYYILDYPLHTEKLTSYMAGKEDYRILNRLPLVKLINYIKGRFSPQKEAAHAGKDEANEVINRYFKNKEIVDALAKDFNITSYFVIQPIPTYNYNLSYHIISNGGKNPKVFEKFKTSILGYPMLAEKYRRLGKEEKRGIIWLADMQLNKKENLYADAVHYNAAFSEEIARHISNAIKTAIC